MSKIIKESGYRELSHIVKSNDKYYLVDSNDTIDAGYETMVFFYNIKDDEVEDWGDLYCERYYTEKEMKKHHFEVCKNLEKYLYDEVEIIEEPQEHKIPEKLSFILHDDIAEIPSNEMLMNKINEILKYLEEIE